MDCDSPLGSDGIDESGGGIDELDFSTTATTGVTVNLASTAIQTVNANLKLTLLSGVTVENVTGSALNDVIYGNALANTLNGEAGHDVLLGAAGKDVLVGGDGRDILFGGSGADELRGGKDDEDWFLASGEDLTPDRDPSKETRTAI